MPLSFSTSEALGGGGLFLKSHGQRQAQREFEVKDGTKRRRLRRSPKAILEFKFSLRSNAAVRFKERWLHSSTSYARPRTDRAPAKMWSRLARNRFGPRKGQGWGLPF